MRALLAGLGEPQLAYPAVHVVGPNGKSTTTRMTEALLSDAGLSVGAYVSPHVRGWSERIRIANAEADFERSLARVRSQATALQATQFEALTAAALLAFAAAGVDVAVVEAGLGGRHDATNVLQSRVVVLTNVALDHTDVLGDTREAIAAEKLAVVQPGATVVLAEPEWQALAEENGAAKVVLTAQSNLALALASAEAFLGIPVHAGSAAGVALPGRLERRSDRPLEIWDGAHNLAGVAYLLPRIPDREYVLVSSILADKRPELMLEALSVLGGTLVATQSSNSRSLPAGELAACANRYFDHVETIVDPAAARRRALALAGPDGAVLVSGSLYLLTDLSDSG
jgi:dihydrofolate synthase/folylpolyglutamate synthase